jgi:hypothetical protein
VKRLLLAIGFAVGVAGCSGSSSDRSAQDEAGVAFKPPMVLSEVLDLAHEHQVQPTELIMELRLLGETISSGVVVEAGMSDADIERRVRESVSKITGGMERSMRAEPLHIHRMLASGSADDLLSLRNEAGVSAVGLKSEMLERVRRAREGR